MTVSHQGLYFMAKRVVKYVEFYWRQAIQRILSNSEWLAQLTIELVTAIENATNRYEKVRFVYRARREFVLKIR